MSQPLPEETTAERTATILKLPDSAAAQLKSVERAFQTFLKSFPKSYQCAAVVLVCLLLIAWFNQSDDWLSNTILALTVGIPALLLCVPAVQATIKLFWPDFFKRHRCEIERHGELLYRLRLIASGEHSPNPEHDFPTAVGVERSALLKELNELHKCQGKR